MQAIQEVKQEVKKERFYRWDVYKKKYIPCQGIPVELIDGYEGFLYETKTKVTCYFGLCGMDITTEYYSQFCRTEEQKEAVRQKLIDRARNMLQNSPKWREQLPKILEQNGISPRYDENGNVKAAMKKPLKQRTKKVYEFYVLDFKHAWDNNASFKPQTGDRVTIEGEEFFLYKEDRYWKVIHGRSGATVINYKTSKKRARDELKILVEQKGIQAIKEAAEKVIAKYGLSPLYQE